MNKLRLLLVLCMSIVMLFGCNKWTEPDFKIENFDDKGIKPTQFWTIGGSFVLGAHTIGNAPDSLVPISKYGKTLRYIRAVVVSSDEGGNFYKTMTIQDSTGGVALQLDMTGLYNTYPVGQKIVLVCNGLVIGDYNYLPQIGWIYNGNQVGRINSMFIDQYIIRDGMPSLKNVPKALTNNDIDFSGNSDINKLVCLEGVRFVDEDAIGKPIAFNEFTTEWNISVPLANGKSQAVVVRTSNYAKFRSTIIQNREYNLTGILTKYRDTYQLMIRVKEDIVVASQLEETLAFDFTKNPLENGWSVQSLKTNTPWIYRPSSGVMLHPNNQSGTYHAVMDNWFISPIINFSDLEKGYLRFEHKLNVENANYDAYQVYYTTSTATTFNINDWKPLGTLTSFPNEFGWSNALPIKNINATTFKIAFRYNAPNTEITTYDWEIRKVELRNK